MTVSSAHTLLWGLSTELPDPTDPHLPREGISPLSYLCVDTLQVFQSFLDGPWLLTVTLPGSDLHRISGAPVDGTTLAGIAGVGALLVTDEPGFYQNTGTTDAPVWASRSDFSLPLSLITVTDDYTVLVTDQAILVGVSSKTITLPDASTVPAGYAFDIKNLPGFDTTTVEPPQLAPPATPVPTSPHTGGTVADGVYTAAITYVNALGETVASSTATVTAAGTVADTSTLVIPSPAAETGATGWNAYVSQVGGSTTKLQNVSPTAIGTDLTITAPPTNTGATPPASSTASVCAIDGDPTFSLAASKAAATFKGDGTNYSVF